MIVDKINIPNGLQPTGLIPYTLTGVTEAPCAMSEDNGGYWSDYDAFTIANEKSPAPSLLRYVTDSTAGTCKGGFPQHVSVAVGAGFL